MDLDGSSKVFEIKDCRWLWGNGNCFSLFLALIINGLSTPMDAFSVMFSLAVKVRVVEAAVGVGQWNILSLLGDSSLNESLISFFMRCCLR